MAVGLIKKQIIHTNQAEGSPMRLSGSPLKSIREDLRTARSNFVTEMSLRANVTETSLKCHGNVHSPS